MQFTQLSFPWVRVRRIACPSPLCPSPHLIAALLILLLLLLLLPLLQVVNVDAPPTVSAALCRCMCFPRVVLKCGALREALAFMGHSGDEGDEVRGAAGVGNGWQGLGKGKRGSLLAGSCLIACPV